MWLMDDFVSAAFPADRLRRLLLKRLWAHVPREDAQRRIAVSAPMQREYARRYGRRADLVLGKRWRLADLHPGPRRARPVGQDAPLRIVWVGKYQSYYHEPVAALSSLIRAKLHVLPMCIDLYGQVPPPPDVLIPRADRISRRL